MTSSPIVNGIGKEFAEKAKLIRVNLWQGAGKTIAKRFGVSSAGTTIVIDAKGEEVYRRKSFPSRTEIIAAVRAEDV